jgi:phosphoribosylpyrophosphate synthetase
MLQNGLQQTAVIPYFGWASRIERQARVPIGAKLTAKFRNGWCY